MDNNGRSKNFCIDHIFEDIISLDNLYISWKEFKRGKIKKRDVQEFEMNLEDNLFNLRDDLVNGTYKHSDYTSFYLKDPKLRHIHKAGVRDRIVHHAIYRILYPIFDKNFIFDSYSCRNDKGTHKAVNRLAEFTRKVSKNYCRACYCLKCDIKKFFISIDHDILLNLSKRKICGQKALWLILEVLESYNETERERERE